MLFSVYGANIQKILQKNKHLNKNKPRPLGPGLFVKIHLILNHQSIFVLRLRFLFKYILDL